MTREVTDKQGALTYIHAYDSLYQLVSENGLVSYTYQNDSLYNRTAKDNQPYDINALNQLLSQTGSTYRYAANGNLIEKITDNHQTCYVYDALDSLIEFYNGTEITKYRYDSFHRRLSKTQNDLTTHYIYQNQNEIEAHVQGEIQTYSEKTLNNPWKYSSKRFDSETGFVFFGRRYYDPTIGRWTTSDPAGFTDGPNLYAYAHNQPLAYIDPGGRSTISIHCLGDRTTSRAVAHGTANFAISSAHVFKEGAVYIGSDDLGFSLDQRVGMSKAKGKREIV